MLTLKPLSGDRGRSWELKSPQLLSLRIWVSTPTYSHTCMDSLVRVSRRVIVHLAGQHTEESRLPGDSFGEETAHAQFPTLSATPKQRELSSGNGSQSLASFRGGAPKSADHGVADHVMTRVGRYQRKKLHLNRSTTSVTKSDSACRIAGEQSFGLAQVQYACTATVSGTFNSLSKVLCTFPSRYLFSIGLE